MKNKNSSKILQQLKFTNSSYNFQQDDENLSDSFIIEHTNQENFNNIPEPQRIFRVNTSKTLTFRK